VRGEAVRLAFDCLLVHGNCMNRLSVLPLPLGGEGWGEGAALRFFLAFVETPRPPILDAYCDAMKPSWFVVQASACRKRYSHLKRHYEPRPFLVMIHRDCRLAGSLDSPSPLNGERAGVRGEAVRLTFNCLPVLGRTRPAATISP